LRKIKVPGCSVCKEPYDWSSGIKSPYNDGYILCPLCKHDEDHKQGYIDILVEVIPISP
jgi:hypothetical protein